MQDGCKTCLKTEFRTRGIDVHLPTDILFVLLSVVKASTMAVNVKQPDEVLTLGLVYVNIPAERQARSNRKYNVEDFAAHFGTDPLVISKFWELMQTTDIDEARIVNPSEKMFKMFMMTMYYFTVYPTEKRLKGWGLNEKTARTWIKFFVEKISALEPTLIKWPSDEEWGDLNFITSHDGLNLGLNEPTHATLHKDKRYFDRKGGKAGHTYEIALHLWESRIVWFNGPFPANSGGDRGIFVNGGLNDKIPDGKKSIADKIYKGLVKVALHNSLDTEEVRLFKRRARARQESVNIHFKKFGICKNRFRHGIARHDAFMRGVAVIVALELTHVSPLFDI